MAQSLVERDEEVVALALRTVNLGQPRFEERAIFPDLQIGGQFAAQVGLVGKREVLSVFFKGSSPRFS